MSEKSIIEIAEEFGLTVETVRNDDGENEYKVLKGLNTVATGNETDVTKFLSTYAEERPPMLKSNMYGYTE